MLTISISAEASEAIAATLADGYELRPARTARATIWPLCEARPLGMYDRLPISGGSPPTSSVIENPT
jgi:hypothetical protein